MKIKDLVLKIQRILNSFPEPRLEAELLTAFVLKCTREHLYCIYDKTLSHLETNQALKLAEKRKHHYPMAYILGKKEFYSIEFNTPDGVFIPRPDTETLVQKVRNCFHKDTPLHILDLGCGNGCIGLALLLHFPKAKLIGLDISETALKASRENAKKLKIHSTRTLFLKQDALTLSKNKLPGPFQNIHLIVANPPYIAASSTDISEEVRLHEPSLALYSKDKGYFHQLRYLKITEDILADNGHYFFEIGQGQNITIFKQSCKNLSYIATYKDDSKIKRVVHFQKQLI